MMKEEGKENKINHDKHIIKQQKDRNYLNHFSLQFVDERFEIHYIEDTIEQRQRLSQIVTLVVALYTFTVGTVILFKYNEIKSTLANLSYAVFNLILLLNIKKHYKLVSKLLFFSFTSYLVVSMEVFIITRIRANDIVDVSGYYFFSGLIYMLLMFAFATAIHKWYLKTIIIDAGLIYYSLRTSNPYYIVFKSYPMFYFMIVIFAILFYQKEKFERSIFYKLYKKQEENQAFKDLLENTVPSSIFVAKLRNQKQPQDSNESPIKTVSNKINRFLAFCKKTCSSKQKQKQIQNNNQHTTLQNQNDHNNLQPHQNTSNMKIVFANSHCKRKFATSNLEFLQKNMNYLFSHGSIQALKENSQGSSEDQPNKKHTSTTHLSQEGHSQDNQICILEYIWEKFQKIEVIKSRLEKHIKEDYFGNEEVHLNFQEYENLKKYKEQSQYIHDLSEKSHQIEYQLNGSNSKKKENENENESQGIKNKIIKSNCLKDKLLCCFKKRNSDRASTAIIPIKQLDENNQQESPTKFKKPYEKKNFLYIPDEMRFDIKIVKCKWEDEQAVMVLLSDISQKVVIDRMRQINTYKNEMLASITHNLKTPLNAIMLQMEAAILSNSIQIAQQQLTLAQNSGKLLLYMINDILDYSRINTSKPFQLTFKQFYLQDVLFNIQSMLWQLFVSKNIQFQFEASQTVLNLVLVNDKQRIEQVLLNLCQNALKFTFQGSVKVMVFEDEKRPNELFFTIKDTGLGISEEVKQNLFKIYANTHLNSTNKRHGVGLGLAVCRKLVSQIGSEKTIQIESQKGKGSSFTFSIYKKHPLKNQDEIFLPKFRSLKYIHIKKSFQNKNEILQNLSNKNDLFQGNMNYTQQNSSKFQLNKQFLSGNSLQNLKKTIQLEENSLNNKKIYSNSNESEGQNSQNTNNIKSKDHLQINCISSKSSDHIILEEHDDDCKPVTFDLYDQNSQLGNLERYFMQESKIHPQSDNNLINHKTSLEIKNNIQTKQNEIQINSTELFNLVQSNSIQIQYNAQSNTNQQKKSIQPFKNNFQYNFQNNQPKNLNTNGINNIYQNNKNPNNNNIAQIENDLNNNIQFTYDILNTIQTSSNQLKNPDDSNSTEFENLNQVSSEDEDNCSEKIQQISIPKIPTKSYRNLTDSNLIKNDNINKFEHRKSDSNLLTKKSNFKKSQKKNKTHVQFLRNWKDPSIKNQPNIEISNGDLTFGDQMTDRELLNEEPTNRDIPTDRGLLAEELTKRDFFDRILLQRDFSQRNIITKSQLTDDQNNMDSLQKMQMNNYIQDKSIILNNQDTTYNREGENRKALINNVNSYPGLSPNNYINLSQKEYQYNLLNTFSNQLNQDISSSQYYQQYFLNNTTSKSNESNMESYFDRSKQQIDNLKTQSASFVRTNDGSEQSNIPIRISQQLNPSLVDQLNQLVWRQTKLLIVDDTIFNVIALKNILKNVKNFTFDEAYNGEEALQKVKQNKDYDLILMDINMPVLDGFESTSLITKMIEQNEIPPTTIIIVSAFSDETDRMKSFKSGAKAHIDKPVTLDNIFRAIKTVNLPHLQNQ